MGRLIATAEYWAMRNPRTREFRFEGSAFCIQRTIFDRLIVAWPDGRGIIATEPFWCGPDVDDREYFIE